MANVYNDLFSMQKVQEGNNSFIPGLQQGLPCSLPSINTLRFPNFLKDLFFYFENLWQLWPVSYSWFSHDVTKIQTKKLSLLLSFYFYVILEHLKTFIQKNFRFKRVLCFAIQDAWISRLLRDAAFGWRPGKLLSGLKTLQIFGDFAI